MLICDYCGKEFDEKDEPERIDGDIDLGDDEATLCAQCYGDILAMLKGEYVV
jgi:hypothetical protein